jgi:precorrin-6B methylase 2
VGLCQGDALSYILFNMQLEKVVIGSGIETKGNIYNKTTQILKYEDNIVLATRTAGVLKEAITNLSKNSEGNGTRNQRIEN